MLALPQGAAETAPIPCSPPTVTTGWPGRNGARCAATPIGPMPGPPPPCGMQKVLWRLRWQTSAPMSAGPAEADLGVHVRAVHVDLAAVRVDDRADLLDALLEDAVGRRIGDHQRGQVLRVRRGLGAEIGESMLPCASQWTATTTRKPAIAALAGLVPWADWSG